MRIDLNAERVERGEIAGAWRVSAWRGNDYLGEETFLYYNKREALSRAKEIIKERGGLGLYARA